MKIFQIFFFPFFSFRTELFFLYIDIVRTAFANRSPSFSRQFKKRLARVVHVRFHVGFPGPFRRVISIYKWEKEEEYNPLDFPRLLAPEPPKSVLGLQMLAHIHCTHVWVRVYMWYDTKCVCFESHVWESNEKHNPIVPSREKDEGVETRTSSESTCGETRKPVRLNNARIISDNDRALMNFL